MEQRPATGGKHAGQVDPGRIRNRGGIQQVQDCCILQRSCTSTPATVDGISASLLSMTTAYAIADAEATLARARKGDPEALEQVYRAYEGPVYAIARRICRTAEDAEDVLQETFFEVCRSLHQFRGQGSLWSWIRTIASSKARMRLRRNRYREVDELHDELHPGRREDGLLRMDLEAALERLPETSRAVVWLHDVEGYTHEEIGDMMGKTVSFSKSQLARAHARLRRWLGEEQDA
jgi:RNA polymerase sigma-70 factor (ECF subfamily)